MLFWIKGEFCVLFHHSGLRMCFLDDANSFVACVLSSYGQDMFLGIPFQCFDPDDSHCSGFVGCYTRFILDPGHSNYCLEFLDYSKFVDDSNCFLDFGSGMCHTVDYSFDSGWVFLCILTSPCFMLVHKKLFALVCLWLIISIL